MSSFVLSAFLCFQNQKMMATLHCRPLECMCLVKDLVTTRLPVALPGGLVTRNCGIVAARIYGYFYTHVQDSSEKCHKINLMKNEKTLVTRLVMRNLFSSSLFLFEWIHPFEWWPSKKSANEKRKGSENQTSTTEFTVIKVHNATTWNG